MALCAGPRLLQAPACAAVRCWVEVARHQYDRRHDRNSPDGRRDRARITIAPPKTRRSRRTIKVPAALIIELERHRREQLQQRLKVGLGGRPELVFTTALGAPITPKQLSEGFTAKAAAIKPVTFHCLRHTHITQLLRAGVPVHVVSARAGHAKPSITLDAYSHLLGGEDNDAAKQAEAI